MSRQKPNLAERTSKCLRRFEFMHSHSLGVFTLSTLSKLGQYECDRKKKILFTEAKAKFVFDSWLNRDKIDNEALVKIECFTIQTPLLTNLRQFLLRILLSYIRKFPIYSLVSGR